MVGLLLGFHFNSLSKRGISMNHLQGWLCLGLMVLSTSALHAFVADENSELESGLLKNAGSFVMEKRVVRPQNKQDTSLDESDGLGNLQVLRDQKSGAIRLLYGNFEEVSVLQTRDPEAYISAAKSYVEAHSEIFGIHSADLRVLPSALLIGKDEQFIKFHVYRDGIRIKDAVVDFRFKFGKLLQIVNQSFAEAKISGGTELTDLLDRAESYLNAKIINPLQPAFRVVETVKGYELEKVMSFQVRSENDREYNLELDVVTGKIHELSPNFYFYTGKAQADLYPRWYDDQLAAQPLSVLDLQSTKGVVRTDAQGAFNADPDAAPQIADGLTGQFVTVADVGNQPVKVAGTLAGNAWQVYAKQVAGQDKWTDKLIAQNMIYDKTTEIIRFAQHFISTPWFNTSLVANSNLNSTCNAHWDGRTINLYSAGNGCANTGLIADVMYHEWGHGLHHNAEGIEDGALSEGFGDIMSVVMTHSHLLGVGFKVSDRSPVRDLSANRSYPRDAGEVHSEGMIIGTTFWELFQALKAKYGEATAGTMLANYSFKMIFTSRTYLDVYHTLLVIDSNGGDPTKLTPNQCLLNEVFNHHGLAPREAACEIASVEGWEVDGSATNILRPGSTAEIKLNAHNAAPQTLTGLEGTLLVNDLNGAVVEQSKLTWDAIPSGTSVLSRDTARLRIPATATCGDSFHASINLKADTRELAITKEWVLGRNEGQQSAFAGQGLPQPIKDFKSTKVSVDTTAKGWGLTTGVSQANVAFDIHHSFLGDLVVTLKGPDGTSIQVYKGSGRGPGVLHFNADLTHQLKGKKISGAWQLTVADHAAGDEGTLDSFNLTLTPALFNCN